jgi:hypothetical protein
MSEMVTGPSGVGFCEPHNIGHTNPAKCFFQHETSSRMPLLSEHNRG